MTTMITWPDLRPVLRDIPWTVVGGVATRAYMPERGTQDLDILVRHDDGDEVLERLEAAGYKFITPLVVPGFLVRSPEGVEVDVVLGDYPWLEEALDHLCQDPAGLPVLDLPYLVIMKLEVSRVQDTADSRSHISLPAIFRIITSRAPRLTRVGVHHQRRLVHRFEIRTVNLV